MRKITRNLLILCILMSFQIVTIAEATAQSERYPREASLKSEFFDGPYVVYKDDTAMILTAEEFEGKMVLKTETVRKSDLSEISVYKSGFMPRNFKVKLKQRITKAPVTYPEPENIFALSDIEGNFNVCINLLQQHGIIDTDMNWTFGKGHLVLIGDVFDRGNHVTELLWYLYKLEDLAKADGGMVHLIIGNHETMNMRGDLRYLNAKYTKLDTLLQQEQGMTYTELYGKDSELGSWLRAKNVIERIGNNIFVHGGISPELLDSGLSLEEITSHVMNAVEKTRDEYNEFENLVMRSFGPLWYRGYFREIENGKPFTGQVLEQTLSRFNAKYVVVGHNVVKKPIRMFNGRIVAIDVVPPKDHQIRIPLLTAYGIFIQGDNFTLADENGNLEKMEIQR